MNPSHFTPISKTQCGAKSTAVRWSNGGNAWQAMLQHGI
uniref:Uncharacterized protein n=1 Tax=Ralstonia solanacearum TaxID=305 RepID=A0A0S4V2W6_RALSL|nr:protein of unknown function [Ralstonia solanacearum]